MGKKSTALALSQRKTLPAVNEAASLRDLWIGTAEFAELAGIDERNARKAAFRSLNGHIWHGTTLEVRAIDGCGGKGGKAYQVYVPSLPADLRATWQKRNPSALESPTAEAVALPAPAVIDTGIAARVAERDWKLAIIAPALVFEKGSQGRAEVLRDIASRTHRDVNGKLATYSIDTLRDWCAIAKAGDHSLLARPRRTDAGALRCLINRTWDKACPLPSTEKQRIADNIRTHIRGLWRECGRGEKKIASLASSKLLELSKAAGWHDATLPLCAVGLHVVRAESAVRLVAIKDKDAKKWFNNYIPRIHRSRDGLRPMDIVIGDVHPVDILLTREDGSEATARMIAWLDLATNDIFYSLVLLQRGKGITQAHITRSFVDMVQAWGLPRWLYFDNGKEYEGRELIEGFLALQGLVEGFHAFMIGAQEIDAALGMDEVAEAPPPVTRAKPYNAPAKAIEGMFSALEKFLAMIPGHIGGDRMRKKTHNVGKAPKPFPGTWDEFGMAIADAVAFYRNEPQRGTMGGKSVNDRRREAIAAGWQPVTAHRSVMLFAFARVERVRVHTGGIQLGGEWFQDDVLVPIIGEMIEVRYAAWDGDSALWIDPNGRPVLIGKAAYFHPMDRAGAKEQGRLVGLQNEAMRALAANVPKVDLLAEMARNNAAMPPPPETPPGTPVTLAGEAGHIVKVIEEGMRKPSVPARKLPPLAILHPKTGEVLAPAQREPEPAAAPLDLFALPPPKRPKADASGNAPAFDLYQLLANTPSINSDENEQE